jgi:hypothetical protein
MTLQVPHVSRIHVRPAEGQCENVRKSVPVLEQCLEDLPSLHIGNGINPPDSMVVDTVKLEKADEHGKQRNLLQSHEQVDFGSLSKMKISFVPGGIFGEKNSNIDHVKLPENLKMIVEASSAISIQSNLSTIRYPFTKEQENYYTSFWMQSYTEDVLDMASTFPKRFSSNFFAEFLVQFPHSWKWFLFSMDLVLGSALTEKIHDEVLQSVLSNVNLSASNREITEALRDSISQ